MKLEATMKAGVVILRGLMLLLAMMASPAVRAVWIEDAIPANVITVTASVPRQAIPVTGEEANPSPAWVGL